MGSPEIICRSLAGQFTTILCLEVLQHWTNFYFSFTDCILTMLDPGAGGGGYSAENGVQLCAALKTLLSRPPDPSLKPPFQNFFSSSRSYIRLKLQISGKFAFQRLKITEQTFTLASLILSYHVGPLSPGGILSWKWGTVQLCAALKTPLSRPPDPSLKPPFQNVLVPQDPTFAWNHKFLENLHFKGSKLKKSSVLMPNIRSSFSLKSLKLDKKSVL